ncbi:MAG: prephenate dehydrogenase/arogenate dehydrogenase family protein, partial [Lachnospiraceae bacterium]|nr:prephenate dehydrogenase/arogenate dehydrogenase family protein [Lachnospiraceae bacterium]
MTFNTIGFVGLGLIGGSVAKSIKRVHPEITIVGYNRNQEVLKEAVRDGVIDITSDDSLEAFR